MNRISIIIPLYNGNQFIFKCLDSIYQQAQFLDCFETIIINDGSTDNSLDIIYPFTIKFPNIKIITKSNEGLGYARNTGIGYASYEYLWFVDQDDWLTNNSIQELSEKLNKYNPDLVYFDYTYPNGKYPKLKQKITPNNIYEGKTFLNYQLVENPVWHYLINREFLLSTKMLFHARNHEDTLFTPQIFFKAKSVLYIDKVFYIYNLRNGSLSSTLKAKDHCLDIIHVINSLKDFATENNFSHNDKKILNKYIALSFTGLFYYWKQLSITQKKIIVKQLPSQTILESLLLPLNFRYIIAYIYMKNR